MHPEYNEYDVFDAYEYAPGHYWEEWEKKPLVTPGYKAVRKKPLVTPGETKECAECNEVRVHDENDFVCRDCRAK